MTAHPVSDGRKVPDDPVRLSHGVIFKRNSLGVAQTSCTAYEAEAEVELIVSGPGITVYSLEDTRS